MRDILSRDLMVSTWIDYMVTQVALSNEIIWHNAYVKDVQDKDGDRFIKKPGVDYSEGTYYLAMNIFSKKLTKTDFPIVPMERFFESGMVNEWYSKFSERILIN